MGRYDLTLGVRRFYAGDMTGNGNLTSLCCSNN